MDKCLFLWSITLGHICSNWKETPSFMSLMAPPLRAFLFNTLLPSWYPLLHVYDPLWWMYFYLQSHRGWSEWAWHLGHQEPGIQIYAFPLIEMVNWEPNIGCFALYVIGKGVHVVLGALEDPYSFIHEYLDVCLLVWVWYVSYHLAAPLWAVEDFLKGGYALTWESGTTLTSSLHPWRCSSGGADARTSQCF